MVQTRSQVRRMSPTKQVSFGEVIVEEVHLIPVPEQPASSDTSSLVKLTKDIVYNQPKISQAEKLDNWRSQFQGGRAQLQTNRVPIEEKMPPCSCRRAQGLEKGWCCIAGGGVPACDH